MEATSPKHRSHMKLGIDKKEFVELVAKGLCSVTFFSPKILVNYGSGSVGPGLTREKSDFKIAPK